jgi:hypothetical protein
MQQPTTWKQLVDIVSNQELYKLKRDANMLNEYKLFMDRIKREFVSVEVYLAHKVFDAPLIKVVKEEKEIFDLDEEKKCAWKSNRKIVFRPNDFPYFIKDGIHHDILWSNETLDSDTIKEVVSEKMKQLERKEFIYFENPVQLKTVPNLFHIHIFSLESGLDRNDSL